MRPEILFPLFKDITGLAGVGKRTVDLIEKIAGPKVVHLILRLPASIVDRRYDPKLADAIPGRIVTLRVTASEHIAGKNRRQPYRIFVHDDTGELELTFFHAKQDYLVRMLPPGEERLISRQAGDLLRPAADDPTRSYRAAVARRLNHAGRAGLSADCGSDGEGPAESCRTGH